ncbi:MAG: N-acetyltransferase [Anaerolineae bacterium]|nr:N-acetyltransferase [Anaerolineae bacterium]
MFVHPTAEVEEGAIIGAGSKIWHLCHIRRQARIGEDCVLGRGVFVDAGVEIGSRVKIQNYVSVFHGVTIEDGVFVGPHVCFTNDMRPRAVNPDMSAKSADDWTLVETLVKAGAALGANSTIVCGTTIGRWAMVGAGSVVTRDVPDYGLVVGNPARLIGYVCACGNRQDTLEAATNCDCSQEGIHT